MNINISGVIVIHDEKNFVDIMKFSFDSDMVELHEGLKKFEMTAKDIHIECCKSVIKHHLNELKFTIASVNEIYDDLHHAYEINIEIDTALRGVTKTITATVIIFGSTGVPTFNISSFSKIYLTRIPSFDYSVISGCAKYLFVPSDIYDGDNGFICFKKYNLSYNYNTNDYCVPIQASSYGDYIRRVDAIKMISRC